MRHLLFSGSFSGKAMKTLIDLKMFLLLYIFTCLITESDRSSVQVMVMKSILGLSQQESRIETMLVWSWTPRETLSKLLLILIISCRSWTATTSLVLGLDGISISIDFKFLLSIHSLKKLSKFSKSLFLDFTLIGRNSSILSRVL